MLATDINECYEGTHNCDPLANCVDTDGSYTCECRIGYTGTGWACSSKYIQHIIKWITCLRKIASSCTTVYTRCKNCFYIAGKCSVC